MRSESSQQVALRTHLANGRAGLPNSLDNTKRTGYRRVPEDIGKVRPGYFSTCQRTLPIMSDLGKVSNLGTRYAGESSCPTASRSTLEAPYPIPIPHSGRNLVSPSLRIRQ
jgi:hypothetical protein